MQINRGINPQARDPRQYNEQDVSADVVFCIDATGSMRDFIAHTKDLATSMFPMIKHGLEINHRNLRQFRIRYVAFREFFDAAVKEPAIEQSDFFVLSDANGTFDEAQSKAFFDSLSKVKAVGGGDDPENALEAFVIAMRSDFIQDAGNLRHVIVIATDQEAHALSAGGREVKNSSAMYPENMPASIPALKTMWEFGGFGSKHKPNQSRLIIMAPQDKAPWGQMTNFVNNITYNSIAGNGLRNRGGNCQEAIQGLLNNLLASIAAADRQ